MTTPRRIFFELVQSAAGELAAVRVPVGSLQARGAPIADPLAAMISRLGLAECVLVDDSSLIFCREATAAARAPIPRGIRLFLYV